MITRKDYMSKRSTFTEFYRAVNKTAGLVCTDKALIVKVRAALDAGDEHLNTVSMAVWDTRALRVQGALSRAFKAHGDCYSPAGGVCATKQAARDAAARA